MLSEVKHLYVWNLERFYLSVIASEHNVRARQSTGKESQHIKKIQRRLIASGKPSQ
ncbi:MAG: hypothetical protein K2N70_00800 [Helicobacter sp.]|nr:hypothetical protein [Helicobacter sp.]